MTISPELLWFALFIWIAFSTEIATGFGSIIIALALGALILPIEFMLPILVTLNVIMNSTFLSRIYRQVDTRIFFRRIFPLMLVGMVIGVILFPLLPETLLKIGFALLVIWFAAKSLFFNSAETKSTHNVVQNAWIGLAGVTHGLYASGGPLLVLGLTNSPLSKAAFRATLLATWCSLNFCYMLWFLYQGVLISHLKLLLIMLPVLLLAAITGQYLHKSVNEVQFKKVIFSLLLVCGSIMLVNASLELIAP